MARGGRGGPGSARAAAALARGARGPHDAGRLAGRCRLDIALTDVLCCPRCGPPFGLVLLADRVLERRLLEGVLGCPSCLNRYPVRGGFADLRVEAASGERPEQAEPGRQAGGGGSPAGLAPASAAGAALEADTERGVRLAALLGLGGPGLRTVALLVGESAGAAQAVAQAAGAAGATGLEVVAADARFAGEPEREGVSRLAVGGKLPFLDGRVAAVALGGSAAEAWLEEGARVLEPAGRLLLEDARGDAEARLEAAGVRVVARQGRTLLAVRR